MGSACCVAARDRTIPQRSSGENVYGNVRYSPSWSFRWDNRRRVAGEVETSFSSFSDGVSNNNGLEIKSGTHDNSTYESELGSPLESLQTPVSQKSPGSEVIVEKLTAPVSDGSVSRSISLEVKEPTECTVISDLSPVKLSPSAPSTSSVSVSPQSSKSHLPPVAVTPLRWPYHSSGQKLSQRVSDGQVQGLKSSNDRAVSEEKSPFVLPAWSNESTRASHGGSSDSWSMNAFSELMVTSQRERWSFDSEPLVDKMTRSSSRVSVSPSLDVQACGVCSKLLTERASWRSNELSVVAVLTCGHVYHADCLENMTSDINKYDPVCPICTLGEKQTQKMCERALKAEIELKAKTSKKSRNRVVDSDFDGDFIKFDHWKSNGCEGKGPKMGSSSSMKNSLGKPFMKRHFSFASKGSRSVSESQSARKKGFFWTKSSRE